MLPSLWLLLGVPLAPIGMFLSIPGFMRLIGTWLNRAPLILLIYLWYEGGLVSSLVVLSYMGPNYLYH